MLVLVWLTRENNRLDEDISRLEGELGQLPIKEIDRVHIVAVKDPFVPPEIAPHVQRIWRYRLYLPAGYDMVQMDGEGRVTEEGVFLHGGLSTRWSSPKPEPKHTLLTICFSGHGDQAEVFSFINGSISTLRWGRVDFEQLLSGDLVFQHLSSLSQGSRSFDTDTILPLLKVYDPRTAKTKTIDGSEITTYKGGLIVLCPKSRESDMEQLQQGRVPEGFQPSWVAKGVAE